MSVDVQNTPGSASSAERFNPRPTVLVVDRFMNQFIKIGGTGVIAAVLGIFVFITWQIVPLFAGAKVSFESKHALPIHEPGDIIGIDEWSELPFVISHSGSIYFTDIHGTRGTWKADVKFPEGAEVTAFDYLQQKQAIIYGMKDGRFMTVSIGYEPEFVDGVRVINAKTTSGQIHEFSQVRGAVKDIGMGMTEEKRLIAAIQETTEGRRTVSALALNRARSLFGGGKFTVSGNFDLTPEMKGVPQQVLVSPTAEDVLVVTENREVWYFHNDGDSFGLRQRFSPFAGRADEKIRSIDYLFGGVSLVATNGSGENIVLSLYRKEGDPDRMFHPIKSFDPLPRGADVYAPSLRNKGFLLAAGDIASLRYSTTEEVRWQSKLPFRVKDAAISGKYDKLIFLDDNSNLHFYHLDDHHPEAGIKAFFSKIWYEGYPEPSYEWQSTGGSDEFESKLSLVPLIIGSLKGTLYALLFALPIALLAAVYTSQFAHAKFKNTVKPLMEIMASLPSVVLGFLAALWLAPLIETKVPSLIMIFVFLPMIALSAGVLWIQLPKKYTLWLKSGHEFIALIPVVIVASVLLWNAGPWLESVMFGGDFKNWWTQGLGLKYDQRNSLVVGFVMGFAVIPLIFTISEDALSNVAPSLRSASLAMGASRWQTAMRVVIPSASAGILSAVMIGFGRAVGETMIVVMATGNTPIMDFNIFSGMRTLSANIAVELPEAPFHGTLYRTLFLGALALFLMTFCVNTIAEILRERLRAKYKSV